MMSSLRILGITLIAVAISAGTCIAQEEHQDEFMGNSSHDSRATQLKRCENLGVFVKDAATARDNHETESHFAETISPRTLTPGMRDLTNKVFASNESPATWQNKMRDECEQKVR
jgi:hypothetical protein